MKVELLQPEETREIISKIQGQEPQGLDFHLRGHINAVCREEHTGEEVWSIDQDNLITDFGKLLYVHNGAGLSDSVYIFVSSFQDTPDPRRPLVCGPTDAANFGAYGQFNITGASSLDHSKWWSCVFPTPSATRTLSMIGITHDSVGYNSGNGPRMTAYSRITPYKIQTTSQTLEVTYKIFFQSTI